VSHKNKYLTFPLLVLVAVILAAGVSFVVKVYVLNRADMYQLQNTDLICHSRFGATLEELQEISWLLYVSLSLVLAGDLTLAIIICTLLYCSRTGQRNTNSVANTLLAYTINSGLLTSMVSAIVLFTVR
jgi:hypothetical protein